MRARRGWMVVVAIMLGACAGEVEVDRDDGAGQCLDEPNLGRAVMSCGTPESSYIAAYQHEELAQCTDVPGRIHVSDEVVVDATRFSALRSVGSLTFFRDESMTSVHGLQRLRSAGALGFTNMGALSDLGALSGLCEVADELYVTGAPSLASLEGLHHVSSVGALRISNNAGLRDLDGLAGLRRVAGDVVIEDNPALSTPEAEAFVALLEVGGEITVVDNGE